MPAPYLEWHLLLAFLASQVDLISRNQTPILAAKQVRLKRAIQFTPLPVERTAGVGTRTGVILKQLPKDLTDVQ